MFHKLRFWMPVGPDLNMSLGFLYLSGKKGGKLHKSGTQISFIRGSR